MAVLQEINLQQINVVGSKDEMRRLLADQFWVWFYDHKDQKVTTVKVWFISKTVYVRDLRSVFILLFGEPRL